MASDSLIEAVRRYVEDNIDTFHQKRQESLLGLKLDRILGRKNPYLFKAKNIELAQDLVRLLLDAHLSSQEETLFGNFLESLAIHVSARVYGGRKSSTEGIDLEFDREQKRYLVSIKSGPNWGNSSQITKMRENFRRALRVIRQNGTTQELIAVNGCCYGRDSKPDKGDYHKYCGQAFWELISGRADFYVQIVEPLGHRARAQDEKFQLAYAGIVNRFTLKFSEQFCASGSIDWEKLVAFNSATRQVLSAKDVADEL